MADFHAGVEGKPVEGAPRGDAGAPGKTDKTDKTMTAEIPFVDLKAQYRSISTEVDASIQEVLEGCDFILGEKVSRFEKEFASFCGVSYAVGVASGTEAIHLALRALGVGPGDEVITQANTFIATPLSIAYTGARPVFVDVDPETYNMDPALVEEAVTEKTKAVIPVHLYGKAAPMDEILEIAERHSLFVVEDACQAHGALYRGKKRAGTAGSMGHAAAFSFYPGKNLGAYGDAGMVTTDDGKIFEEIRMLRNYGQKVKYHHALKGFNSRLDTIQAAVLTVKLRRLRDWNAMRVENARLYSELLEGVPEVMTPEHGYEGTERSSHVFHLYVIRARERDSLLEHLRKNSIAAQIHYPLPCHLQEAFRDQGSLEGDFPVTEALSKEILSLPMYPELKEREIERVAETIAGFYRKD